MSAVERKLNLAEVTAIGIGGMIGGGIFAVLGLAISTAGNAVAIAFVGGGAIALLTGLSYAHLGLAFRDDGGSFTYIERAFAAPIVAGTAGWLLVVGYVGTLALYASAFGDYGAALIAGDGASRLTAAVLTVGVLAAFLGINLLGAKLSGGVELGVVAIKLAILTFFVLVSASGVHRDHFEPLFDKGVVSPFMAMAFVFVAYEGFELIPNAVNEMADPDRNLRRAIVIAVLATTALYVVVAIVALGNLSAEEIGRDKEYVLAVAARPALGQLGFVLIGLAALLSTASAINATLFGASRLAMVMARDHALPRVFSMRERTRPVPHVSLMALTGLSILFALTVPLSAISAFASGTFLLIFAGVNLAAVKLARAIGLNMLLPLAGCVLSTAGLATLVWYDWQNDRRSFMILVGTFALIVLGEWIATAVRGPRRMREPAGDRSASWKTS